MRAAPGVLLALLAVAAMGASAAPGDLLSRLELQQGCSYALAVGLAFDGEALWFTCVRSSPDLLKADPVTGEILARYTVAGGLGAIAYDAGRGVLWAADGGATLGTIFMIRLEAGEAVDWGPRFQGILCAEYPLADGLAYDPDTDLLYHGCDADPTVVVLDASDGRKVAQHSIVTDACVRSGLAITAGHILVAAEECPSVVALDKVSHSPRFSFDIATGATNETRNEALACDWSTFAPLMAVWVKDASPSLARAFEVPPEVCVEPPAPIPAPPGRCLWRNGAAPQGRWPMPRADPGHRAALDKGEPADALPWAQVLGSGQGTGTGQPASPTPTGTASDGTGPTSIDRGTGDAGTTGVDPVAGSCQVFHATGPLLQAYGGADGSPLWGYTLDGAVTSIGLGLGVVAAATDAGTVGLVGADAGELLWTASPGGRLTTPILDGQHVYVASSTGHVYAFDQESGRLKWEHNTGGAITASPWLDGDVVHVITAFGDALVRLDASTGNPRTGAVPLPARATTDAAYVDGTLYIPSGRMVVAFSVPDRKPVWWHNATAAVATPTVDVHRVAIASAAGLDVLYHNGTVAWSVPGGGWPHPAVVAKLADNATAFVAKGDGAMAALNLTDGLVVWQGRLPAPLSAFVHAGPTIYVRAGGYLVAFNSTLGTLPQLPPPTATTTAPPTTPPPTTSPGPSGTTTSTSPTPSGSPTTSTAAPHASSEPPRGEPGFLAVPLAVSALALAALRRRLR